jgi:hypothetical protein
MCAIRRHRSGGQAAAYVEKQMFSQALANAEQMRRRLPLNPDPLEENAIGKHRIDQVGNRRATRELILC